MMRGPSYDDAYISRKLSSFQSQPTYAPPPPPPSYGRYMQYRRARSLPGYRVYFNPGRVTEVWYMPGVRARTRFVLDKYRSSPHTPYRESVSVSPTRKYYQPRSRTQLILNRVSLTGPPVQTVIRAYPPMGPPRLPPRMVPVPSYYDYDYPYAGGYGGYTSYLPPPVPRMSRYDAYLDDDLDVAYQPRYRPRVADSLDAIDTREKSSRDPALSRSTKTTTDLQPYIYSKEPAMLQDHVDKMRIRLKSLAYSLDPTGPVPEIVIPGRSKRSESAEPSKKYSMGPRHLACVDYAGRVPLWKRRALTRFPPEDPHHLNSRCKAIYEAPGLDYAEMPRLSTRKQRYYPEDEHMKDNLRIKCLSHYKTTRNAAVLPETYTGSYKSKYSSTKWEEPDTVFSGPSDKKPFSKVELGSSFFSTYGYTSRKKDTVAEKVRDYYYAGDGPYKAITDVPTEDTKAEEEPKEEKKERRKKKKSKERDEAPAALEASAEAASAAATASPAPATESEPAPVEEAPKVEAEPAAPAPAPTAAADAPPAEEEVLDEKERKKLEKKRRKAEREAAAKAAMEAELAALAAAEAELARLEAESASIKVDAAPSEPAAPAEAAPAATTEAAPEAKSESAADKCKSPIILESEVEPQVASECPAVQVELESSAEKPVECVPESPLQEPKDDDDDAAVLMDQTPEPYAMSMMTTHEDIEAFLQQEAASLEEPAASVADLSGGQEEAEMAPGEVGLLPGEVDAEAAAQIGAATDDVIAEAAGGGVSTDQPDHVPLHPTTTTITPTTTTATTPPPLEVDDRVEGEEDA